MHRKDIAESIIQSLKRSENRDILNDEIFRNQEEFDKENEFILFMKPEITDYRSVNYKEIIEAILSKLDQYNFQINNIRLISSGYLDKKNIIAQHYGVINKLACNVQKYMSSEAITKFQEVYRISANEAIIKGSLEFLANTGATVEELSDITKNVESVKLAGGTYCQKVEFNNENIYLINAFHPSQLMHYIADGHCIITFSLASDTAWSVARQDMIGCTNPLDAKKESLRGLFLNRKDEFGIPEVSYSLNCVHLSAGPVEGLCELMRFNDGSAKDVVAMNKYKFGKKLLFNFTSSQIDAILSNSNVSFGGENISVFDLTEEKNTTEAFELLKKVL